MHFRKFLLLFFICHFLIFASSKTSIDPSNTGILYTGRVEFSDPSNPVFSFNGVSIEAYFTGSGISANFSSTPNTSYLYVIIDDQVDVYNRQILEVGSSEQSFELVSGLSDTIHKVEIVKLNQFDTKVTFHGFEVDGEGLAEKPQQKELFLEFYGDSNPAGHSTWDTKDFGAISDNGGYFTYPGITARMLNADFSNISGGGAGVTNQAWWNLVNYHHLIHMNDAESPANLWDFENNFWNRSPDAIIINLGANDYYANAHKLLIKLGWKNFITNNLRSYYPDAHIVLVNSYGWAIGEPADYVHEAIEELNEAGDNNVSYLRFPWLWGQEHAVVCEHAGFANLLADHLAVELGLPQPTPNQLSSFADYGKVYNGSFEKSIINGEPDGWRSQGLINLVNNPTIAIEGNYYLNLKNSGMVHYANDAAQGDSFKVTAYMKTNNGSSGKLKIEFKDQGQNIISSATVEGNKTLTSEWQEFSSSGKAPQNCWQISIVLQAGSDASVDYDNVRLEQVTETSIKSEEVRIKGFTLYQNNPNPFNPSTQIKFEIPRQGFVNLTLFNLAGKRIKTLVNKNMNRGSYTVTLNSSDLSSGIYIYQIQTENFIKSKKCILLK